MLGSFYSFYTPVRARERRARVLVSEYSENGQGFRSFRRALRARVEVSHNSQNRQPWRPPGSGGAAGTRGENLPERYARVGENQRAGVLLLAIMRIRPCRVLRATRPPLGGRLHDAIAQDSQACAPHFCGLIEAR